MPCLLRLTPSLQYRHGIGPQQIAERQSPRFRPRQAPLPKRPRCQYYCRPVPKDFCRIKAQDQIEWWGTSYAVIRSTLALGRPTHSRPKQRRPNAGITSDKRFAHYRRHIPLTIREWRQDYYQSDKLARRLQRWAFRYQSQRQPSSKTERNSKIWAFRQACKARACPSLELRQITNKPQYRGWRRRYIKWQNC